MKTRVIKLIRGEQVVSLVGCTHIGTQEYYTQLQGIIEECETVLYEGTGTTPEIEMEFNISEFQELLAEKLELITQKKGIVYKDSWVRADLDIETIITAFNGDIPLLKDVAKMKVLLEKLTPDAAKYMRWFVSKMLTYSWLLKKPCPIIIGLRNYKAILDTVHHLKASNTISLFYGEGHLDHMVKEFKKLGFTVAQTRKIVAFQ
jgi:hypothetical protein